MKKIMTDWEWLTIRVLLLGLTVFLWSYITEIKGVTEVFGDTFYKTYNDQMDSRWGFRHYVYTVTFALLTLVQSVRILKWINVRSEKGGFYIKAEDKP